MGLTEWTTLAARLERQIDIGPLRMAPFVEASLARVEEMAGGIFEPEVFYGSNRITTLNIGARLATGWHPARMGRYGVADDRPVAGHDGHAAH
jgi:hypothetical protein